MFKKIIVIHHTAGKQKISTPEEVGGSWEFYNKIITLDSVFNIHEESFYRGNNMESYNIALTGNFLKDIPSDYQIKELKKLIKDKDYIGHKDLKSIGATEGILNTECPGKLIDHFKEKEKYQTKNKNAFVCLAIIDNEIPKDEANLMLSEVQRRIYQLSNKKLVLDVFKRFTAISKWSNDFIFNYVDKEFDMSGFQAIITLYKKGKFRKAYAETNMLGKYPLINQSFEHSYDAGRKTILIHEFMHLWKKILGLKDTTHHSPNEFRDDFKEIQPNIDKLYYSLGSKEKKENAPKKKMLTKSRLKSKTYWFGALFIANGVAQLFGFGDFVPGGQLNELTSIGIGLFTWVIREFTDQPVK